jgi:hypothetical protein
MTKETFLELIKVGCDWGSKPVRIRHVMDSLWVLSMPGGHASGRGAFGRESVPTTHTVVDLAGDDDRRGYELYLGRKIKWLPEVEGRLSRADIINWQHALGKRT